MHVTCIHGGKTVGNREELRDAPSHVLQLASVSAEIYMFQLIEGHLKLQYRIVGVARDTVFDPMAT